MYRKLSKMPYAQACVRIDEDGVITLISYNTEVAQIKKGRLYISGLYSRTTINHISAFMWEYTPYTYSAAKSLYYAGNYSGYRGFRFADSWRVTEDSTYFDINTGKIINSVSVKPII